MALTQNEIDLITASPEGAAKVLQVQRMAPSEFDDRVAGENLTEVDENGNTVPVSAATKGNFRSKNILRFVNLPTESLVRAWVNVLPGSNGNQANFSADNDYNGGDIATINSKVGQLLDINQTPSFRTANRSLIEVDAAQVELNNLLKITNAQKTTAAAALKVLLPAAADADIDDFIDKIAGSLNNKVAERRTFIRKMIRI